MIILVSIGRYKNYFNFKMSIVYFLWMSSISCYNKNGLIFLAMLLIVVTKMVKNVTFSVIYNNSVTSLVNCSLVIIGTRRMLNYVVEKVFIVKMAILSLLSSGHHIIFWLHVCVRNNVFGIFEKIVSDHVTHFLYKGTRSGNR